jgi:hypothetical protein
MGGEWSRPVLRTTYANRDATAIPMVARGSATRAGVSPCEPNRLIVLRHGPSAPSGPWFRPHEFEVAGARRLLQVGEIVLEERSIQPATGRGEQHVPIDPGRHDGNASDAFAADRVMSGFDPGYRGDQAISGDQPIEGFERPALPDLGRAGGYRRPVKTQDRSFVSTDACRRGYAVTAGDEVLSNPAFSASSTGTPRSSMPRPSEASSCHVVATT